MQVAVAGVEDVGAAQAEFARQLVDAQQHVRQRPARDRAVHAQVVGGDAADRGERRLASRPEQQPLALVLRHADLGRSRRREHAPDLGHLRGDLLGRAVGLDQQDGLRVERIVGVDVRLDGAGRGLVHHLEAAGNDAGGDHGAAPQAPALATSSNAASATCASCGFGVSLTVTSVITASSPSEPLISASRARGYHRHGFFDHEQRAEGKVQKRP